MDSYGIDTAAYHTAGYFLPLSELARYHARPDDYFLNSIGQNNMSIAAPGEDIITLAANAGKRVLKKINQTEQDTIELLILATESSVDQSKAASIDVHALLKLSPQCRSIEMKQACYSATAGLQLALTWLRANPGKKALLIATDIARYQQNSDAEASQGAGAVAMVLSSNPRLIRIEPESGFMTANINDFWRPNYSQTPFVDGKKSCESYLKLMRQSWQAYQKQSLREFSDHQFFCFHIPFPKLVETALQKLARLDKIRRIPASDIQQWLGGSLDYSRTIGNCYTGSLYLSLISLLENNDRDLAGQRIGLYSYGSGATSEYFSAIVQTGYKEVLFSKEHKQLLADRAALTHAQYSYLHNHRYPTDGSCHISPEYYTGEFKLEKIDQHIRYYTTVSNPTRPATYLKKIDAKQNDPAMAAELL